VGIVWIEDDGLIPLGGHGVDFFAGSAAQSARLIAVVRGFEWLHGKPETVEVRIRPASHAFDALILLEARAGIERYLLRGEAVDGQVAQALHVHING
jgi:hypothetical protein